MAGTRSHAAAICDGACLFALVAFAASAAAESDFWCDELPASEFAALERVEIGDDWIAVYAVAPGVFAISEPRWKCRDRLPRMPAKRLPTTACVDRCQPA